MKSRRSPRTVDSKGLAPLELIVVVATALAVIACLFPGTRDSWKKGSARSAACLGTAWNDPAGRYFRDQVSRLVPPVSNHQPKDHADW